MSKAIIVFSILVFSVGGCGSPKPTAADPKTPSTVNSTPSPTPTPFPNQAPVDKSKTKTHNGRGKVTKINLELVSVELDHEEIKGHMPRMIMEFYVSEKSELEPLQIGDTVDFVLEENDGQEKIVRIKKTQ